MQDMAPTARRSEQHQEVVYDGGSYDEAPSRISEATHPGAFQSSQRRMSSSPDNHSWTPSTSTEMAAAASKLNARQVGYREDYSRSQHASLDDRPALHKASSDVGVASSQDHLRFSAYVNRFANHDPRAAPIKSSVPVAERIKRFSKGSPPPPSPKSYVLDRNSPQPRPFPYAARTSPRTTPVPQPGSSDPPTPQNRSFPTVGRESPQNQQPYPQQYGGRQSPHARKPNRVESPSMNKMSGAQEGNRQQSQSKFAVKSGSRPRRSPSLERMSKTRSESLRHQEQVTRHGTAGTSQAGKSLSRSESLPPDAGSSLKASEVRRSRLRSRSPHKEGVRRRSSSPAPTRRKSTTSSGSGSPSRLEQQRMGRSLLAQRRQRRVQGEAVTPSQSGDSGVSANETKMEKNESNGHASILERARGELDERRQQGRSALNNPPNSSAERPRSERLERFRSRSLSPAARLHTRKGTNITLRGQEPVSPMASPNPPPSPQQSPSPQRRSPQQSPSPQRRNTSEESIGTVETPMSASVEDLKKQLWDNDETLQVAVKPSLRGHGYSEKRTKQTTGYYAPEMAGRQGQRVRSLSPNSRRAPQPRERPASSIGMNSSGILAGGSMFKSKFYQAAIAAQKDGNVAPPHVERTYSSLSAPVSKSNQESSPGRPRQQSTEKPAHRSESPRPPTAPVRTGWRSSADESDNGPTAERSRSSPSPRSSPTIDRVPSSSGGSAATGEASVARLVAKLSSVRRDDPEQALKLIDSILKAESRSSSGQTSESVARTPSRRDESSRSQRTEESRDTDETSDDGSSDSSCDDTSVSSITNPTYQQREEPRHVHLTSNSRRPRPSSLNNYTQQKQSSIEETRGKSSKARKEKKPPPPSTIKAKVNSKSDTTDSEEDRKLRDISKSEKERKRRESTVSGKEKKLDNFLKKHPTEVKSSDAAAIAMKIKVWDELSSPSNPNTPSSPQRTVDEEKTAGTDELGSIITPQTRKTEGTEELGSLVSPRSPQRTEELGSLVSPKSAHTSRSSRSERRRSHPWDEHRPRKDRSPGPAPSPRQPPVLQARKGENSSDDDMFGPSSAWRRRRAKSEAGASEALGGLWSPGRSNGATPAHVKNGTGVGGKYGANSEKMDPLVRRSGIHTSSAKGVNAAVSRTSSASVNRLVPNVYDVHRKRRSKSRDSRPTESSRTPRDYNPFSGSKSDTSNVFDSAWVALPADAFGPGVNGHKEKSPSPDMSKGHLPDAVAAAFSDDMGLLDPIKASPSKDNPPKTHVETDALPESSKDSSGGNRLRRGFMKMRRGRSTTPTKRRSFSGSTPRSDNKSKPLLSAYAMDSVVCSEDETEVVLKTTTSRTSKSPARRRANSLVNGEDDTDSLTGSVRNKNLARKFSRFLKVYEDD